MEDGKERLSFLGPGGYSIIWSPGTQHVPLVSAPSGHLVIPLDEFSNGVPEKPKVFHAVAENDVENEDANNEHEPAGPSSSSSTTP